MIVVFARGFGSSRVSCKIRRLGLRVPSSVLKVSNVQYIKEASPQIVPLRATLSVPSHLEMLQMCNGLRSQRTLDFQNGFSQLWYLDMRNFWTSLGARKSAQDLGVR